MPRFAARRHKSAFAYHQHVVWGVVAGAVTIMLLGLVLGSTPVKVACILVGLATLQGLWRGASEVVGVVLGLFLAALLAGPIARAMEGTLTSILGTTGLTNRVASMAIVAVVIVATVGVAGSWFARRELKKREAWQPWDKYAGATLGLIEGCVLSTMILWGITAIEPVARQRCMSEYDEWTLMQRDDSAYVPRARPRTLAARVLEFTDETCKSVLGPIVRATNPLPDSRLLTLANDFAAVSRDEQALGMLLSSEPMIAIEQLASVQSAMERIKADPQLSSLLSAGGITPESLRAFFDSPAMLDILDNTSILNDLMPHAEQLESAVREARASLDARRRGGG